MKFILHIDYKLYSKRVNYLLCKLVRTLPACEGRPNRFVTLFPAFRILFFVFFFTFTFPATYSQNREGDSLSITGLKFYKALVHLNSCRYDSALTGFDKVLSVYKTQKDTFHIFLCFTNLGLCYCGKSDIKQAEKYLQLATPLQKKLSGELTLMNLLKLKNQIAFQKKDYEEAINSSAEILKLLLKQKKDSLEIARNYIMLGYCYYLTNDFEKALTFYYDAEEYISKTFGKNYYLLGSVYTTMALIFYGKAEYEKALLFYSKALNILSGNYGKEYPGLGIIYNYIGLSYYSLKNYQLALSYMNKCRLIYEKNKSEQLGYNYDYLARTYQKLHNYAEAEKYFFKGIELFLKKQHKDIGNLSDLYLNLGDLYIESGDTCKGYKYYKKANFILKDKKKQYPVIVSKSFTRLGDYCCKKKQYKKALEFYQEALIAISENFKNKDYYTNPNDPEYISGKQFFSVLKNKASALLNYYFISGNKKDLEACLSTYELLMRALNQARIGFLSSGDKLFFTENYREIFINALHSAYLLYKITGNTGYKEKAFSIAGQGKAAVLLSYIHDAAAKISGNVPLSEREKERFLNQKTSAYKKYIYEEKLKASPDENKLNTYTSRLFYLEKSYDSLIAVFENKYPKYYKLKYDFTVPEISSVQKQLAADQALVEYTVADTAVYIFVCTQNRFEAMAICIDSSFKKKLAVYQSRFSTSQLQCQSAEDLKQFAEAAYSLYACLIGPIETVVKNKRLIIVPDDCLGTMSFDALLYRPACKNENYRDLSYLIKKYALSYYYSSALFSVSKRQNSMNHSLLAFAPDYSNYSSVDNTGFSDLHKRGVDLRPIRRTMDEIKNISGITDCDILSGEAATEENFKKNACSYGILHLAMHTVIDNENPLYSKLVFTPGADKKEDGLLNAYELYNMDIGSCLIVLSACNTGCGKLYRGEGTMSLARAFIYAGCPGIVMTLWTVDDNSGAALMRNFYSKLAVGMTKDEALRHAKLDFLARCDDTKAFPYFWAAYVSIGDSSPFVLKENRKWYYIAASFTVLMLVILFILFVISKRKKKVNVLNNE